LYADSIHGKLGLIKKGGNNMYGNYLDFEKTFGGKTLTDINVEDDEIVFTTSLGEKYIMHHYQDCCESVYVESVMGDLKDLIGNPLIECREVTSCEEHPDDLSPKKIEKMYLESFTWTFYIMATKKGVVTIRWIGSSNGFYSESVYLREISETH
jgi:hypothetical protein